MSRSNPFYSPPEVALPKTGDDPLEVVLYRGGGIESRHRVQALVLREDGKEEFRFGKPNFSFYPRSTLKMIQVIPWLRIPDCNKVVSDPRQIAIACGSHHAEKFHVDLVDQWLEKLGAKESDLECGTHDPANKQAFIEMIQRGEKACQVHNNCSGKHCGFLTWAKIMDWDFAGYSNYDHPLQVELRRFCSEFLEADLEKRPWGIDGCGIPTYSTELRELALGMLKLAVPEMSDSKKEIETIQSAIQDHPLYIGGTLDFSSRIVAETQGRVFAKVGAEGVYGLWVPSHHLGIALKCEDGNPRACEAAIVRILSELGFSIQFHSSLIRRWSGEVVGQLHVG